MSLVCTTVNPAMHTDWENLRVTVMGLGRFGGGVGVTRWLASQGARVTVTDRAAAEDLQPALEQLANLDLVLHLGNHDERDFIDTDLLVVNPAVRPDSSFLHAANLADVPLTTEINLFVERCPAHIIGVTGSVGKSTVTAMLGHLLARFSHTTENGTADTARFRRTWIGGNIGHSLLVDLDAMSVDDVVVLELSSFQLERTPLVRWSPQLAVITPISPNHLDWHGSIEAYCSAKANIARFQEPGRDALILPADPQHPLVDLAAQRPLSDIYRYSLEANAPTVRHDQQTHSWPDLHLDVPGRHNRENATAVLAAATALGLDSVVAAEALATYTALPHRLQRVAQRDEVKYYDDSKSTTPTATLTALAAFDGPVVLILGGYDKGSDLEPLAQEVARRAKFTACIGTTGPTLAERIRAAGGVASFCHDLASAVVACQQNAHPGDVVLLSPACASWDQFPDYRARGNEFVRLVRQSAP